MSNNKPDPIVVRLRELRTEQNIKQKDVAEAVGVGYSAMSSYESGQVSPQLGTLRDWSGLLGFRLELVENSDPVRKIGRPETGKPDPTNVVRLTPYQTALALGMLLVAANQHRPQSPEMADHLVAISDALSRAL